MVDQPIKSQRQRILQAAAVLFRKHGYPATTVRQIAAEVSLGASSLYNHIHSKQELLKEICFTSATLFSDGLDQLVHDQGSAACRLKGVVNLHVRLAIHHPETVTVFNDEWRHLELEDLNRFKTARVQYEEKLMLYLSEGIGQEKFESLEPDIAIPTLLASFSWIYNLNRPSTVDKDVLSQRIFALWAHGWIS